MRRTARFVLCLSILLLFGVCLSAADVALTGGTVYRSPNEEPLADAVILIHGKSIAAVGTRASVRIPKDARIIDCTGAFITAGFWNSHVHIFTPGLLHAREAAAAGLNEELDAIFNRWGFTTVFDVASVLDNTLTLRRRIDSGEVRGPRILTVGEPLWTAVPVYVQDYLAPNHISMAVVSTPPEAAAQTRALISKGVDGIKLFTGSMQANGVANMPLDMVKAAVQEAHRHQLPVFAHPQNVAGLEDAIDGGVDILAHTAPQSPPWTAEFVARLKNAHMALIPTLTLFDFEARKAGDNDANRQQLIDKVSAELRIFSRSGGEVLFGTDVGYTSHFDTSMEFTLMSGAGMSFPQILASLTTAPAARFGYSTRSGRLAPGMDADVVVLDADPANDINALSRVRLVIRGGQVQYSTR